jgi:hypothetical protein
MWAAALMRLALAWLNCILKYSLGLQISRRNGYFLQQPADSDRRVFTFVFFHHGIATERRVAGRST